MSLGTPASQQTSVPKDNGHALGGSAGRGGRFEDWGKAPLLLSLSHIRVGAGTIGR